MGTVVAAFGPGVGRRLVVPAGGDQHRVGAGDAHAEPADGAAGALRIGMRRFRMREEAAPVRGRRTGMPQGRTKSPRGSSRRSG